MPFNVCPRCASGIDDDFDGNCKVCARWTDEELAQHLFAMEIRVRHLLICQKVEEPLPRGTLRGFHCTSCNEEVQVSPVGQYQLKAHTCTIMCNDCGFKAAELAASHGNIAGVEFNPRALSKMREWNDKKDRE